MHVRMSFSENRTYELWKSFMPRLKEISARVDTELYSGEVYDSPEFFRAFNPTTTFEKWAMVPVEPGTHIPEGMSQLVLPEGKYAIFTYKGRQSNAADFYRYIYATWLPASGLHLDHRPHLAIMGEKYKRDDDDSEEEILIPVKSA